MKKGNVLKVIATLLVLVIGLTNITFFPNAQEGEDTGAKTALACYVENGQIANAEQLEKSMNELIGIDAGFVVDMKSDAQTVEEAEKDALAAAALQTEWGTEIQFFYNIDKLKMENVSTADMVISFCQMASNLGVSVGYSETQASEVLSTDYILYDKRVYSNDASGIQYELNCYLWSGKSSGQLSQAGGDTSEGSDEISTGLTGNLPNTGGEENEGDAYEITRNGWSVIDEKWYYYENGIPAKGEKKIDGKWYYFNETSGEMITGFVTLRTRVVYYAQTGEMLTGEQIIEGIRYYFDTANGAMYEGLKIGSDGRMTYYLEGGGTFQGEMKINGKWYYFDEESGKNITGFKRVGNRILYYDDQTGEMTTGEKNIDGSWYLFSTGNGNMVTGWHDFENRKVYYLSTGQMATGETEIDGSWYLFSTSNGRMATGWYDFENRRVYYLPTGQMAVGEQRIDKNWYYFEFSNGNMITGFYNVGMRTVYYDTETGIMRTGEQKIEGKWYYFSSSNGAMVHGFYDLGARRVFYGDEGYMLTGDQIIDGNSYYFDSSNGGMFRDVWLNGKYYDEDGILSGNDVYKGKKVAILGDSISTYEGWIPQGNFTRYPQPMYEDGVKEVDQTWWKSLLDSMQMEFAINLSQAGRTMTKYGLMYGANEELIKQLGTNGNPDMIFVYMGMNDLHYNIEIGTYEKAEVGNVSRVIDSFKTAVSLIELYYPTADIVIVSPYYCEYYYSSEELDIFAGEITKLCQEKCLSMVDLRTSGITEDDLPDGLHPGVSGMKKIRRCIAKQLMG